MAHIWDMEKPPSGLKEPRGTLYQGYMMKKDYKWDFPLNLYDDTENQARRMQETKTKIEDHAKERVKDRQYAKVAVEKIKEMADMQSSLGFSGMDLFGKHNEKDEENPFDFDVFARGTGMHVNPSSYTTNQNT